MAGSQGQLELNVMKPIMAASLLQSAQLLGDACKCFAEKCIDNIQPNRKRMNEFVQNSLMIVTALAPFIGYDSASYIAKTAHEKDITLKEASIASGYVTSEQFDHWVKPEN